ncbi:hypothetical protein C0J52_15834 [Blattella germanica]|nr:hypothetical protein C0J52_15834 [Blattella germanica]
MNIRTRFLIIIVCFSFQNGPSKAKPAADKSKLIKQNYELYPGQGYYKLHTKHSNWQEAKKICAEEGAHLAIINSSEETETLRILRRRTPRSYTWVDNQPFIGISDLENEGEWKTIFDMPLNQTGFTQWARRGPDGGRQENCGDILLGIGKLNDSPCEAVRPFICEAEL